MSSQAYCRCSRNRGTSMQQVPHKQSRHARDRTHTGLRRDAQSSINEEHEPRHLLTSWVVHRAEETSSCTAMRPWLHSLSDGRALPAGFSPVDVERDRQAHVCVCICACLSERALRLQPEVTSARSAEAAAERPSPDSMGGGGVRASSWACPRVPQAAPSLPQGAPSLPQGAPSLPQGAPWCCAAVGAAPPRHASTWARRTGIGRRGCRG